VQRSGAKTDEDYGARLEALAADIEARARRGEVDLERDPRDMPEEELRAQVAALRTYIREGARARAQDAVMTDLAEEDAADWVRRVVAERDAARERLADERERVRELRSAVAAARRGSSAAAVNRARPPAHRGGKATFELDGGTARALANA
jgi:hypothetical protein